MADNAEYFSVDLAESVDLPMWREVFTGVDLARLRLSPIYYGLTIDRGDGSAVISVPGFLGSDRYLATMRAWLRRVGYVPYRSNIGRNINCLQWSGERLLESIELAYQRTRRKVHLIGHSLGGLLSRSVASLRPELVASVITLGSPIRAISAHPNVIEMTDRVRDAIRLGQTGRGPNADCFTGMCHCPIVQMARRPRLAQVPVLSIYTRSDGVVHWSVCIDDDADDNVEVQGTHCGLAFNPEVYRHITRFLRGARRRRTRQLRASQRAG